MLLVLPTRLLVARALRCRTSARRSPTPTPPPLAMIEANARARDASEPRLERGRARVRHVHPQPLVVPAVQPRRAAPLPHASFAHEEFWNAHAAAQLEVERAGSIALRRARVQ